MADSCSNYPRPAIWRECWRNLHHKKAAIEAEFYVEGDKPTKVVCQWKDDTLLEDAETFAQPHTPALKTYQPILSYNELGSLLDQGPSKLFDATIPIGPDAAAEPGYCQAGLTPAGE